MYDIQYISWVKNLYSTCSNHGIFYSLGQLSVYLTNLNAPQFYSQTLVYVLTSLQSGVLYNAEHYFVKTYTTV